MRKFLRHITTVRGWLTGYEADTIDPTDLGTGTPAADTVLYGDGRWDVPAAGEPVGFEGENKDSTTIIAGGAVTIHASGVGVRKADAATAGRECVGLVSATTAVGFVATVRTSGLLTLGDWSLVTGTPTLVPRTTYFLSATAGRITSTPPAIAGQRVQQIGVAVSADTLVLQILPPILL